MLRSIDLLSRSMRFFLQCGAGGPILTGREAAARYQRLVRAPAKGSIVAEKHKDAEAPAEPVVIKKYANRRLYNTATSSYVTLDHLSEMVKAGADFVVQDARSGEDITRAVLAQIIFEQESRTGQNLLPVQFLRRLINFYGHQMQGLLPSYLDMSMENFAKAQEGWREQLRSAWGGKMPIEAFENVTRQNMQLFENALRMWSPFTQGANANANASAPSPKPKESEDALADMKKQLELMQKQLDQLSKEKP
jgi:polyhydroxyalkanoate synthesis repressor PhaR